MKKVQQPIPNKSNKEVSLGDTDPFQDYQQHLAHLNSSYRPWIWLQIKNSSGSDSEKIWRSNTETFQARRHMRLEVIHNITWYHGFNKLVHPMQDLSS